MTVGKYILNVMIGIFLLSFFTCREETTEPKTAAITVTAEDVAATDVYLHVKITQYAWQWADSVQLQRDDTIIYTSRKPWLDTLILDENLLPKHNYKYKAYKFTNTTRIDSSDDLQITTMDTTSHNISWQIDTLGDGNSSALYDVTIINDTCVYAVGEIYKKDSTGQMLPMYNAVRWDGRKWKALRIPFIMNYGTSVFIDSTTPISSVYAHSSDDVWFCNGALTRLVNNSWQMMNFLLAEGPGRTNKMWGTSSSNMYFSANSGQITRFDGSRWQKLECGTTMDVQDIWGAKNNATGETEIFAVASNVYNVVDKNVLHIDGTKVTEVSTDGLPLSLRGIWFLKDRRYYVVGDGIFGKRNIYKDKIWKSLARGTITVFTEAIRGTDVNDIFVGGDYGMVMHYNGATWHNYQDQTYIYGLYHSCSVKNNLVFFVGDIGSKAVVLRGHR